MNDKHSDFITRQRTAATNLLNAINELRALDNQRVALDLLNALNNGSRDINEEKASIRYGDFEGDNSAIQVSDLAGLATTLAAIEGLLAQGHATNLYKVSN